MNSQEENNPSPLQSSESGKRGKNQDGKATAALVFGILSWLIPGIGLIFAILGIIFGAMGMKSNKRGMAIAGIILSIIGLIVSIILPAIILVAFSNVQRKTRDARITSSMNQLRSTAQLYFSENESYDNLENDDNVSRIKSDIDLQGGTLTINVSGSEYCAEVNLPSGKWWCVDSELSSEEYDSDPACSLGYFTCD